MQAILRGLLLVWSALAQDASCPVNADGSGACTRPSKADANHTLRCRAQGFDPEKLGCQTCHVLEQRLKESGVASATLAGNCLECCEEEPVLELFPKARLIADASQQERDQDLHDFIKRKAPRIRNLEVDYQAGSWPAIELETNDGSGRVLRADVKDWKSDHLVQFLNMCLEAAEDQDKTGAIGGAWSAEIQSCSG